ALFLRWIITFHLDFANFHSAPKETNEDFNFEIKFSGPELEILGLKERVNAKSALRVSDRVVRLETNPEVREFASEFADSRNVLGKKLAAPDHKIPRVFESRADKLRNFRSKV